MPFSRIYLIVAEPVIGPVAIFDPVFEGADVGVSVGLELIPQPTEMSVVVDSLKNWSIIEDWNRQSVEATFFVLFVNCCILWRFRFFGIILNEVYSAFGFDYICFEAFSFLVSQLCELEGECVHFGVWIYLEYFLYWQLLLIALLDIEKFLVSGYSYLRGGVRFVVDCDTFVYFAFLECDGLGRWRMLLIVVCRVHDIFIDSLVVFAGTGIVVEIGDLDSLGPHDSGALHFIYTIKWQILLIAIFY